MKIYVLFLIVLAYSALGDPLPGRSSGGGSRSSGGSRSGGYSHSTSYSRPSSHTSYTASAPKVHVTNTHSYPSSNTHSYPSSNTHSYPSSGGLSGNTGTIPRVSVPNTHSYPSSNTHSYPSSGGLSGNTGAIPKVQVTNTHTYPSPNTHTYPSSNTHTYPSSNNPSYPSSGGLSGGRSSPVHVQTSFTLNSKPTYTGQGQGHSYPSSNGMSGTGTGYRPYNPSTNNYNTHTSYNNPSHVSTSYRQPTYQQPTYHQPSYNQPMPHYTPYSPQYGGSMPVYGHSYTPLYSSGVPHYGAGMSGPTYVSYTSSSGSSLNNVVAGLALYNLMRSNSQSHHYYHHYDNNNNYNRDSYYNHNNNYNNNYNNNNNYQSSNGAYRPPTVEASRGLANCTLYVKSGEESSKIDVPCEFVSSFTDDNKKKIDQNLPKVNSTDECVITSTKNGVVHRTNIACAALEKLAMLQNAPLAGTLNCTEAQGANMYTMTGAPPCKMLETTQPPDVPFEVLPLGFTTTGVPLAPYFSEMSSTTAGTPLATYPPGNSSTTASTPLAPESTTISPPSPDITTKDGLLDVSVLPLNSTV